MKPEESIYYQRNLGWANSNKDWAEILKAEEEAKENGWEIKDAPSGTCETLTWCPECHWYYKTCSD